MLANEYWTPMLLGDDCIEGEDAQGIDLLNESTFYFFQGKIGIEQFIEEIAHFTIDPFDHIGHCQKVLEQLAPRSFT